MNCSPQLDRTNSVESNAEEKLPKLRNGNDLDISSESDEGVQDITKYLEQMKKLKETNKETMDLLLPEDAEEAPMSTYSMELNQSDGGSPLLNIEMPSRHLPIDTKSKVTYRDCPSVQFNIPNELKNEIDSKMIRSMPHSYQNTQNRWANSSHQVSHH